MENTGNLTKVLGLVGPRDHSGCQQAQWIDVPANWEKSFARTTGMRTASPLNPLCTRDYQCPRHISVMMPAGVFLAGLRDSIMTHVVEPFTQAVINPRVRLR